LSIVLKTSDFEYQLPQELIAQTPIEPRDHARLLLLYRATGRMEHRRFSELPDLLVPGDLLVFNDSRVIPARLFGKKARSGGAVELLLLHRRAEGVWEALARPSRRLRAGQSVTIVGEGGPAGVEATLVGRSEDGAWQVRFSDEGALEKLGHIPLPPYIHAPLRDPERYQTVYARVKGSAAAPTAGLHFTPGLLQQLQKKGVEFAFCTLHVGLDTFRPVKEEDPRQHVLHTEYGELPAEAADAINRARAEGRRVVCVGTTTARLLEHAGSLTPFPSPSTMERGEPAAQGEAGPPTLQSFDGVHPERSERDQGRQVQDERQVVRPFQGWVDLFILPGHHFRAIDVLITNFHLPRSTLLMLVSAFAGRKQVLGAYQEAVKERYRFYSFGDAMMML
jgi:S-adenosylmethionine:tRNA ribosyltransferase-isomerase